MALKANSREITEHRLFRKKCLNGADAMISSVYKSAVSSLKLAVACAAILGATTVSPFAQVSSSSDASPPEQITVYPPSYNTYTAPVPNAASHGFAVAQSTSMSQLLNYSDLDLSKPADVKELEKRVNQTATNLCRELKKRFPSDLYFSVSQWPVRKDDCVQRAFTDGMNQAMRNRQLASLSASAAR